MDVVTFGETMVLFNPVQTGPLRYAQQFDKTIGGAESNVAIGLARLGHDVGWMSRLGQDEFGLFVRNFIRGEGVDTSRVVFDEGYPTAVFFKERQVGQESRVYYYRKGSAASAMTPDSIDVDYIKQAKILHLTGITPALSDSCRQTVDKAIQAARDGGVQVVFDPNIRLKLWSREQAKAELNRIASLCDVVLPGIEEGELLTAQTTPEGIAETFLQQGASLVVVKLGARGAYFASSDAESGYVEGVPVAQVVDPIGAGDAFAAGLLSGLLRGYSHREAVGLANRVGAFAVTVVGDVEGLPYASQVESVARDIYR